MNKDAKQLLIMVFMVSGVISLLWLGVTLSSPDMDTRNNCYQKGVENLPQGVDQGLLQTESKAYKACLQNESRQ